jgi:opine dehydrogenase
MSGLRVAVVGAGNGGLAVAGYAALGGADVRLYDIRADRIEPILARGGITVTGCFPGTAPVRTPTLDAAAATIGADLVVLVVAAPDQARAAQDVAAHLSPGAHVLVKPGCTGGALEVREVLLSAGRSDVLVGETDSFAFACSMPGPGESHISAVKQAIAVSTMPGNHSVEILETVGALFPQAHAVPTVLHTGFTNFNAVAHVAPVVANAGRIEYTGGEFEFYGDGITKSVARVVAAYDAERVAVAAAFGIRVQSFVEWVSTAYGIETPSIYETVQVLQRDVYRSSRAPSHLMHRYLTEDVPCGAVPTVALAQCAGMRLPVHESLIQLASNLTGCDYWTSGRTTERLGLAGKHVDEVLELVTAA